MTSFFPMRRERPEMISANRQAVQPRFASENTYAREGAKAGPRVRQLLRHPVGRAQHACQPVQRFAYVRVVEARRRELLGDALAVVSQLGLLAVLEQVDEDVVHCSLPPSNVSPGFCVYPRFPFSRR